LWNFGEDYEFSTHFPPNQKKIYPKKVQIPKKYLTKFCLYVSILSRIEQFLVQQTRIRARDIFCSRRFLKKEIHSPVPKIMKNFFNRLSILDNAILYVEILFFFIFLSKIFYPT